jgi:hypothetical protein
MIGRPSDGQWLFGKSIFLDDVDALPTGHERVRTQQGVQVIGDALS